MYDISLQQLINVAFPILVIMLYFHPNKTISVVAQIVGWIVFVTFLFSLFTASAESRPETSATSSYQTGCHQSLLR